ncbi:MAG: uracil-DNA glycosylase [Armatimonadetes bacterium]|nr:uracil-DNA glycosylase [Armatimonadota bacterium]MDE2205182.1 uracil-DNA glycosylase [Armatimonadota bacterium]
MQPAEVSIPSEPVPPASAVHEASEPSVPAKAVQLATLAKQVAECRRCALAAMRTQTVFGEGNPESPLMLVGEGPGHEEDATGRPFVGRAGKLLDECLQECGLSRRHVYICNVVRCRACIRESGSIRNRPPTPDEISACTSWLRQTIEIAAPMVILCLGAPSAGVIIHKNFRMMQERGRFFATPFARSAIAAMHPAYVLRQHGAAYEAARGSLIEDIAAARAKVIELKRQPASALL